MIAINTSSSIRYAGYSQFKQTIEQSSGWALQKCCCCWWPEWKLGAPLQLYEYTLILILPLFMFPQVRVKEGSDGNYYMLHLYSIVMKTDCEAQTSQIKKKSGVLQPYRAATQLTARPSLLHIQHCCNQYFDSSLKFMSSPPFIQIKTIKEAGFSCRV